MDTRRRTLSLIVNKLSMKHKENVRYMRNRIPLPKSSHQRITGSSGIPVYIIPPTLCPLPLPTANLELQVTIDSEFGVESVECAKSSWDVTRDPLCKRRFAWKEEVPWTEIRLSSVM
jgi:hypothetical protein